MRSRAAGSGGVCWRIRAGAIGVLPRGRAPGSGGVFCCGPHSAPAPGRCGVLPRARAGGIGVRSGSAAGGRGVCARTCPGGIGVRPRGRAGGGGVLGIGVAMPSLLTGGAGVAAGVRLGSTKRGATAAVAARGAPPAPRGNDSVAAGDTSTGAGVAGAASASFNASASGPRRMTLERSRFNVRAWRGGVTTPSSADRSLAPTAMFSSASAPRMAAPNAAASGKRLLGSAASAESSSLSTAAADRAAAPRRLHDARSDLAPARDLVGDLAQPASRDQLEQHGAQRKDVRAAIERPLHRLLGRHVREVSLQAADDRAIVTSLRQPEVGQLHLARERDQDVRRRDVTVDEAERLPVGAAQLVGEVQPLRDLGGDVQGQRLGDDLARAVNLLGDDAQVVALDVLEDDEIFALLGDAEIVDLDDVAVRERRVDARLGEQHLHEALVLREVGEDALDRDAFLEALRRDDASLENLGHPAHGDLLEQLVLAELHGGSSPA